MQFDLGYTAGTEALWPAGKLGLTKLLIWPTRLFPNPMAMTTCHSSNTMCGAGESSAAKAQAYTLVYNSQVWGSPQDAARQDPEHSVSGTGNSTLAEGDRTG